MSEFEPNTARPTDFHLEMLITDVESKFIAAEDALSDLRHAVRQLKLYKPQASMLGAEIVMPPPSPPQPYFEPLPQESTAATENGAFGGTSEPVEAAPYQEVAPKLHQDTVGVPYWPGPAKQEPAPESPHVNENYGLDSTSEASWPIAKPAQPQEPVPELAPEEPSPEFNWPVAEQPAESPAAEPETVETLQASGEEDDEARREEVARIVAQMREGGEDEDSASSSGEDTTDEEEDARRRDVAKMVAELRDSADVEPEASGSNGSRSKAEDGEALRQEASWTATEMRSGGFEAVESSSDEPSSKEDPEATREDVANMVAQMRAEFDAGTPAPEAEQTPEAGDDDAEVRDEVRRAVEAARAEMASGYKDSEEAGASESKFSFSDWQSTRTEPSGPPVIVIKDSEGRVELARVYETLSRVNCDENAALLNYTPHSVTIGLNITAAVPEIEAMSEAVRSVFGRACEVDSDGVRVNVQIGRDLKGKDSAA